MAKLALEPGPLNPLSLPESLCTACPLKAPVLPSQVHLSNHTYPLSKVSMILTQWRDEWRKEEREGGRMDHKSFDLNVFLCPLLNPRKSKADLSLLTSLFLCMCPQFAPSIYLCSLSSIDYFSLVFLLSVTLSILSAVPKVQTLITSHCFAAARRLHFFPLLPSCLLHTRAKQRDSPYNPLTREPYF